jgi:hypothetical protein
MRPTANLMIKDNSVHLIKDDLIRREKVKEIIQHHRDFLSKERDIFVKSKSTQQKRRTISQPKMPMKLGRRAESFLKTDRNNNINESTVTEEKKPDAKKEDRLNFNLYLKDTSKHLNDYNVRKIFKDLISRNLIEVDHNIEIEFRKNPNLSELKFFMNSISTTPEDRLANLFQNYNEKANDFVENISKILIEIIPFLEIVIDILEALIKNNYPINNFFNTTLQICQEVLKRDPLKCETIFIQYGLDIILRSLKHKPSYRLFMVQIIFSLISNNKHSHLQVINTIKKRFLYSDELLFYHLLVKCMDFTNKDNLDLCSSFYLRMAKIGISNQCDFIKIKSIYLVTMLIEYLPLNCLDFAPHIFKHRRTWNWEILSLIVIYCSTMLRYFNELKTDVANKEAPSMDQSQMDQAEVHDVKEEELKTIGQQEELFLAIIDEIFQDKNPNMTVKTGFIYLAEILQYYPILAKKYIKLLIEFKYVTVMKETLEIDALGNESTYTNNCYTEFYKTCGAPLTWSPIVVAGIFRDYVKENFVRLEYNHLEIFYAIIINQMFNEDESDRWIEFYNDIVKYLFISLCQKELSNISLSICKKIFSFRKILNIILESSFDIFISSMMIIYKKSVSDESHKNMLELLTYISEIAEGTYKPYIYKLLKTFAIMHNDLYLSSNLVELMNKIHQEERGEIFQCQGSNSSGAHLAN